MDVKAVSGKQSFEGNIILKNKISTAQNYLFNLHRGALEQKIQELPFDLFVEQSKSRKTISIWAGVENPTKFFVRKNKQNFEEIADYAIADGKNSEFYKTAIKIKEIFEYKKAVLMNIMEGKFKQAKTTEQVMAKESVENFEAYKAIPHINIKGAPREIRELYDTNSRKYFFYRLFTRKTPEEKKLLKLRKEYIAELRAKGEKIKTVEIELPYYLW